MITVVTATLPERTDLLRRATDSVRAQTLQPVAHLIGVDHARIGGAAMKNLLAAAVNTEWIALLDDDDYFYPDHLQSLIAAASSSNSDVAYSYCDVVGQTPWLGYNQPFSESTLRATSSVSHNAIVRADLFRAVGGFKLQRGYDWLFWVDALNAGARFACVERPTWLYDLSETHTHESRS